MDDFKDLFKSIEEKKLIQLIQDQKFLSEVPDDVDRLIMSELDIKKKLLNQKRDNFLFYKPGLSKILAFSAMFIILMATGLILYFGNFIVFKKGLIAGKQDIKGELTVNNRLLNNDAKEKNFFKNDLIATGKNSSIQIKTGDSSAIILKEQTSIKILEFDKKKNYMLSKIYLEKGSVKCSVKLPSRESGFEILTDAGLFTVKGTEFSVEIMDNRDIVLTVERGTVESSNIIGTGINMRRLKDYNAAINEELLKIMNYKIQVKENETLVLKTGLIDKFNMDIREAVNYKKNKQDFILKQLNLLNDEIKNLSVHSSTKQDIGAMGEKTQAEKIIQLESGTKFTESETIVSTDNKRFIFISCNKNKALYCYDASTSKLKWKLTDARIKNITSPAILYKDKIILGTPDGIFIINNNGKIIDVKLISKGPNYWSSPVIIEDKLYIPGFETIYSYDGSNFGVLSDSIKTNGQIYMNYNNKLYFSLLNEKKIKAFDLIKNNLVWDSGILKDRVFMPPAVEDQNLYIADAGGNIYKFDTAGKSKLIVKNENGIISDVLYSSNYLYFIANDGFFYRINTIEFNKLEKLDKVDNNPEKDNYLIKKIINFNGKLYYGNNVGRLFVYNPFDKKSKFIDITSNNIPLIGSPIIINDSLFLVDSETAIYDIN